MGRPLRRTTRDIRRDNQAALLHALYFNGPATRQDLLELTGLSTATISNVTTMLLSAGVLAEAGRMESDGGRPRALLVVNPGYDSIVGVDVGETRVRVELFDLSLTERAKAEYSLAPDRHDAATVVDRIVAGFDAVLTETGHPTVIGVGVGVPGIVEHGPDGVIHARAFGWDGVPLGGLLRQRLRPAPPHVFVDNGAVTMGQAELWFGAGKGVRHAIVALIGSGVGSCIVTDGVTYRGSASSAGEWGHTTIAAGGRRCRCGSQGCLEAYIGAEGILDRYRQANPASPALDRVDEEEALAKLLVDGANSDVARAVVAETVDHLGIGLANLINLFNPERIVLGGWAGLLLAQHRLADIRAATAGNALAEPYAQTEIVPGQLGPDAVAEGAATLVIEHFLQHSADVIGNSPR